MNISPLDIKKETARLIEKLNKLGCTREVYEYIGKDILNKPA